MANIQKIAKSGKLVAAGPMAGNGDLRGIFIFKAASMDEAKALVADDPAIKSGRLIMDIQPWWGPKGIGKAFLEAYLKDPNTKQTMTKYYLALLSKGANWSDAATPESRRLQVVVGGKRSVALKAAR
jgi:hypothetical protein